ncbi:chaplin [Streptomyces axinellae]|uniref:Chaplin domain-containing protein n=1 Tax=Streptomyces axinellae TaxID=552788 RepID=A0ABN3QBB6_9ACTN
MRIRTAIIATGLAATAVFGGAAGASADSGAMGGAAKSPGVLSGNVVQVPVEVQTNVCGNSINVIGLLNPAAGNRCKNR